MMVRFDAWAGYCDDAGREWMDAAVPHQIARGRLMIATNRARMQGDWLGRQFLLGGGNDGPAK